MSDNVIGFLLLPVAYELLSSRTIRLEGSVIVTFSFVVLLPANNSANFAAVTVMDTEFDKSSKKFGSSTDMDGFVPKLEPRLKVVPVPEETVYISLLDIDVVSKSEILPSAIVERTASLLEVVLNWN